MKKVGKWLPLIVGVLGSTSAWADTNWTNAGGGNFGEPTNWNNGVPVAEDQALIAPAGDYTITLDQSRTIRSLRLTGSTGEVTLDLGGYTLSTTSTTSKDSQAALVLSGTNGGSRIFNIQNGTLEVAMSRIGAANTATMNVHSGATLKMLAGQDHFVGNSGNAVLNIANGGKLEVLGGQLMIGSNQAGVGTLNVRGENARFESSGAVFVGHNGVGHLLITEGAQATFSTNFTVGRRSLSGHIGDGDAIISDGAVVSFANVRLGHGARGGMKIVGGADVTASAINIYADSILEIDGATVQVSGSSTWGTGSTYNIHLNGVADKPLTVDSLTLSSTTLVVQLGDDFVAQSGAIYSIIDYTGTITGSFVDGEGNVLAEGALIAVGDYIFTLTYGSRSGGGTVGLTISQIPEPAHMAQAAALVALCMILLRRRYRQY